MSRRLLPAALLALSAAVVSVGVATAQPAAPFPNCSAARAAGYSDIPSSSPYYGTWLDRDSDGVGCES
ncbi:putative calcium-binding protein [Mycolicibacterium aurum]|uniref:Putative calcium-binding protein n=1 Tax=Mycolicibacterium aurum TaxID=1791 RepID=A0A3S4T5G6_MYCAU|nr:excalibur calcium-binding domain-containing protein [Mycolicibacterium aurum]VEG51298.1 putative calcium-binding protein [Mycolicibacterium aurum]